MVALRSTPDVILLESQIPGGTGIEVHKRLRASSKTLQIPVIVVSSDEKPTPESRARELGAVDSRHRPVDQQQLSDSIHRVPGIQANAS